MKERLKLSELTVKTFVTSEEKVLLKGGYSDLNYCISITCPTPDKCGADYSMYDDCPFTYRC